MTLFLHETHRVRGAVEDEFEAHYRDRWMAALAEDDDARLAWYTHQAHGTGPAYRICTAEQPACRRFAEQRYGLCVFPVVTGKRTASHYRNSHRCEVVRAHMYHAVPVIRLPRSSRSRYWSRVLIFRHWPETGNGRGANPGNRAHPLLERPAESRIARHHCRSKLQRKIRNQAMLAAESEILTAQVPQ